MLVFALIDIDAVDGADDRILLPRRIAGRQGKYQDDQSDDEQCLFHVFPFLTNSIFKKTVSLNRLLIITRGSLL